MGRHLDGDLLWVSCPLNASLTVTARKCHIIRTHRGISSHDDWLYLAPIERAHFRTRPTFYLFSYIFETTLSLHKRSGMRRSVWIAGGGAHVGRACTLMPTVPAPGRILLPLEVRAPYFSVDQFRIGLVWSGLVWSDGTPILNFVQPDCVSKLGCNIPSAQGM